MSLTTGIQAASATPATDFYALINTKLTALGWVFIEQMSAATAGTTDVVEVWKTAATTVSGTVHTGCILYIEHDDTNARLRFRVSEVYDSSVAGSPASRVKWAASGITTSATSTTPAASYSMADTYGPLFVTASTTSKVGWVNIPVSASGFAYWIGGGAARFLVFNNSGGYPRFCLAGGPIETLLASGDTTSVYLAGSFSTTPGSDVSWTLSTTEGCNVRTSREPQPFAASVSQAGAFCFRISRAVPDNPVTGATADAMGGIGNTYPTHKFHGQLVVSPAVMHGMNGIAFTYGRSHRGYVTGMIVTNCPSDGVAAGDTITVAGTVYTIIGSTPGSATGANVVYAVDSTTF